MTTIGLLLFPGLTQLDLTGPYEVFSRMSDARVLLVSADGEPVRSEFGLVLAADVSQARCPDLDVLCVPGGGGVNALLNDAQAVAFVKRQAGQAQLVCSVCTGALLLGVAGVLEGRRAATHWASMDLLPLVGAIPVNERTVVDGNVLTGGGVTAGIDLGLAAVAQLRSVDEAQRIQLQMEYRPRPPFNAGHPDDAPAHVTREVRQRLQAMLDDRRERLTNRTRAPSN